MLFAKREIIVNGFSKSPFKFINAFTLKRYDIAQVNHFAIKNTGFMIKFNLSCMAFIVQYLVLPWLRCSNRVAILL